jgi:hypothetical protein
MKLIDLESALCDLRGECGAGEMVGLRRISW